MRSPLRRVPTAIVILVVVLSSTPLLAAEPEDNRWTVRLYGAGLYPSGSDVRNEIAAGLATFGVSSGTGFGVDLAYRLSSAISLEVGYLVGDFEADFTLDTGAGQLTDTEDIAMDTLSLGVNYHFTPESRADLHAGVLVAMSTFDGVIFLTEEGLREKRPFDDDVGFGLGIGVDIPFGASSRWSFNARIRYLIVIMEAESASGGRDLDLDPLIPSIGIGYRF